MGEATEKEVTELDRIHDATMLLPQLLLADAAADPELNPNATKEERDKPGTIRISLIMLMLDGIDRQWLIDQINAMNRYESIGFMFAKPMEYQENIGMTPRLKDVAELLLKLKHHRDGHLAEMQAKKEAKKGATTDHGR